MPRVEISAEILDFIYRRIDSIPHLEALLLLWEKPSDVWSEEEISKRVYVSRDKARLILQDLLRHGFIVAAAEASGGYRYEQGWDEAQIMPRMAASYRQHLVHVSNLIHSKAASDAGDARSPCGLVAKLRRAGEPGFVAHLAVRFSHCSPGLERGILLTAGGDGQHAGAAYNAQRSRHVFAGVAHDIAPSLTTPWVSELRRHPS